MTIAAGSAVTTYEDVEKPQPGGTTLAQPGSQSKLESCCPPTCTGSSRFLPPCHARQRQRPNPCRHRPRTVNSTSEPHTELKRYNASPYQCHHQVDGRALDALCPCNEGSPAIEYQLRTARLVRRQRVPFEPHGCTAGTGLPLRQRMCVLLDLPVHASLQRHAREPHSTNGPLTPCLTV